MNINILKFESIDSTNTEAIKQARSGALEGLCIVAREQTAGRGRHGRKWSSGRDSGLYFSIVLRPQIEIRFLPLLTLMTGVAVFDTLLEFRVKPDIKWVNDLMVDDKKIGGILTEAVETPVGLAVIVGIGINLLATELPDEIAPTATSVESETGDRPAPDDVSRILIRNVSRFYDVLCKGGEQEVIRQWKERSSYFRGKSVRVALGNGVIEGVTDGLEDNGALRVLTPNGSVEIVQAGDVQQLRPQRD